MVGHHLLESIDYRILGDQDPAVAGSRGFYLVGDDGSYQHQRADA
jgi:hypothetical protein